ncbi:MAG: TIGR03564 family F420-dependent LLM class oxidoreductase [Chloroflexota bacterium]|nr:TIGR03564 family F420-dependent LLM class oxidoreductase [Chloroflexota bacterium]
MRIGVMLGEGGVESQVKQVVAAENDGFDNVWFGQVFGLDAMTVIAIAGGQTSRIEMGTSVVPTYARHPFVMAQQAMTVQAATGSRFVLGIGLSHQPVIEGMWGMSYEHPARHMKEYLSVLLPLVREGRVSFSGDVYRTAGAIRVPDMKPLPVMIAALAPRMLRLAGEMTDGTVTWMTGVKTIENHVVPSIHAAAKAAGRPDPRVAVGLPVCVSEDVAAAREVAAKAFQIYGQLPNYRRMLDKEGAGGPADVAIVGNEGQVERQIRAVASAGATDFFAPMFPVGADAAASLARTRALLRSLVGNV